MLQRVDGLLVVVEDGARREGRGDAHRFRRHVRVAVVVATDPRAGAHDRGAGHHVAVLLLHVLVYTAVDGRDLAEQADAVVAQPYLDLVLDARTHAAYQGRLPQQRHPAADH